MKRLRTNSAKPVVLGAVYPNAGVESWYQQQLDKLVNEATGDLLHEVAAAWAKTPPLFHNAHITALDGAPLVFAAGVMFRCGDDVLLMQRIDGSGWAWPGGGVEGDESAEEAARREVHEETGHEYDGPLELHDSRTLRGVHFRTFVADVEERITPILNDEHTAHRWVSVAKALKLPLHPGVRATLEPLAEDAPSPTKALQAALAKWGAQTIKRFDLMSAKIANDFTARNAQATQTAVLAQLKKAGFTVKFKPTRRSMEAFRVVAAENVALIKSIPRKYHEAVEQKVWNAVRQGSDLNKLSAELRKAHKVTVDRAALIARDQNAKAKATIERMRQLELGIHRGIWQHSAAGKEPRPTHVAMDGKQYDLTRGMWDSDEQEWVHPGQLINCRCTMRPVIEGFED